MTVKLLETGEIRTVDPCYGARLVEQGKAVVIVMKSPARRPRKKAVTGNGTD